MPSPDTQLEPQDAATDAGIAWRDGLTLLFWVLTIEIWFQGPFAGGRVPLLAALPCAIACLACISARIQHGLRHLLRYNRVAILIAAMALLATAIRLPALLAPAGLITSDSAVAGLIAQDLTEGRLPAPIYAPGFPYEGTLKPHLTALFMMLAPWASPPGIYAWVSNIFYIVWLAATVLLAWRLAGGRAGFAAGVYMAVSPRFLTAFSLNNVGQYPEVNALGALSIAWLGCGGGLMGAGFIAGVALWQQFLGIYFVITLGLVALLTPRLRGKRALLAGFLGLLAGSYPTWAWNVMNSWQTFIYLNRGALNPADRILGVFEKASRTIAISAPKLLGIRELDLPFFAQMILVLAFAALLAFFWRAHWRTAIERRAGSPAFLLAVLFVVVMAVFFFSKLSNRGIDRPRYLTPLYTIIAVALGVACVALARRALVWAALLLAAAIALNLHGTYPWLRERAAAHDRALDVTDRLYDLGVRRGYTRYWVAAKYTYLSRAKMLLVGELGPEISWVHPRYRQEVRQADSFILDGKALAEALAARLDALQVRYQREDLHEMTVFCNLSRPVALSEVKGYESASDADGALESADEN